MTNKELIEALQALPPDAYVELFQPATDHWSSDSTKDYFSVVFDEKGQIILLK